jgi:uncharacterized protein
MKPCLVDVNVWLALVVRHHQHHNQARKWYETLGPSDAGLCRIVSLGLIRLLATPSVMGVHALAVRQAYELLQALADDERVEFLSEPPDIDALLPGFLNHNAPAGKLVTDAYIAAFAICSSRRLATLDRGFRRFHGLDLMLL